MSHATTVYDAARRNIKMRRELIETLREEIAAYEKMLDDPKYDGVLEADRLATRSEAFQSKPLPT